MMSDHAEAKINRNLASMGQGLTIGPIPGRSGNARQILIQSVLSQGLTDSLNFTLSLSVTIFGPSWTDMFLASCLSLIGAISNRVPRRYRTL
jgi:hypothetical protein